MMNIDLYNLVEYAFPVANVCLLAAATMAMVRIQRVLAGKAIYSKLAAGSAIEARIAEIDEHCRVVSERLGEIQDQIESFSQLERLLVGPVSREFPMEHAARLAKGGASVDELTRNCGLNIGEARLVRRLHGQPAASRLS
jgi:hypothetical protein